MKWYDVIGFLVGWGLLLGAAGGIEQETLCLEQGALYMVIGLVLSLVAVARGSRREC